MKLAKLITDKVLAHPAWSGVASIVAIIALAVSVIQLASSWCETHSVVWFCKNIVSFPIFERRKV
jgi:hypothetical protein